MTKMSVGTDYFLTNDLHYALGRGQWNEGNGHVWIFDADKADQVKEKIINNFITALDELFENEIEVKVE